MMEIKLWTAVTTSYSISARQSKVVPSRWCILKIKIKTEKVKTHWSGLHSVYFNKIQDDLKQTKLKTMDNSYISATDSQIWSNIPEWDLTWLVASGLWLHLIAIWQEEATCLIHSVWLLQSNHNRNQLLTGHSCQTAIL